MLRNSVWVEIWYSKPHTTTPRRCDCDAWSRDMQRFRPGRRVLVGAVMHWERCDVARDDRRPLLCLECAEARLGRRIAVADLMPCIGNYYAHALDRRWSEAATAVVVQQPTPLERLRALASPTPADHAAGHPYRDPPSDECGHGVTFELLAAEGLSTTEIRRRWPRLDGECPLGCGYRGIAYASTAHMIYGDW